MCHYSPSGVYTCGKAVNVEEGISYVLLTCNRDSSNFLVGCRGFHQTVPPSKHHKSCHVDLQVERYASKSDTSSLVRVRQAQKLVGSYDIFTLILCLSALSLL